ncbi:hypothetical protein PgNI_06225 [Pyricularia grisea]|uniref:Uncharacterized protein n=1 Tax=Pyricularia grisea TaxID=148305 RepID=A0A6P8B597_PYRGI|nr:hypothetical protein PgNI_06225 [Pyricularia grisea]TLD10430.1 hypothetical protein PgNI_06225 [Pyricularia grisea]
MQRFHNRANNCSAGNQNIFRYEVHSLHALSTVPTSFLRPNIVETLNGWGYAVEKDQRQENKNFASRPVNPE